MAETRIYEGWIAEHEVGEAFDILFLSEVAAPLADEIHDAIASLGPFLSVRYFTSEQKATIDELTEEHIRLIVGAGDARLVHRYSEITGYLWTDEDLNVGGHDLLAEPRSAVGQWCHLEITFSSAASGGEPTRVGEWLDDGTFADGADAVAYLDGSDAPVGVGNE